MIDNIPTVGGIVHVRHGDWCQAAVIVRVWSDTTALEPEPIPDPKPEPIEPTPVDGAADLPDDVKNGEIPGEDDPAIADRPPTTEE